METRVNRSNLSEPGPFVYPRGSGVTWVTAMARKLLNAKSVEHLKPSDRRQEISDAKVPALRIVISPTGARSWALRCRIDNRPVKLTLGPVEAYTLKRAREWASDTLLAVKAGRDPRAEKRERAEAAQRKREEEEQKRQDTVATVVERWLATDQADNRTVGEVAAIMRLYVLPAWGDKPIGQIRKRDVVELVERVAEGDGVRRGAPIRANRLLAHIKRMFSWAAHRDLVDVNFAAAVEKPAREVSRDRVLDDDEVVAIWRAAEDFDAYGRLVRLLIVTGCRLNEIAQAKVDELVEETKGRSCGCPRRGPRMGSAGPSTCPPSRSRCWASPRARSSCPPRASGRSPICPSARGRWTPRRRSFSGGRWRHGGCTTSGGASPPTCSALASGSRWSRRCWATRPGREAALSVSTSATNGPRRLPLRWTAGAIALIAFWRVSPPQLIQFRR